MSDRATVRVGLVGTSWWAEAMYLPALADHPDRANHRACADATSTRTRRRRQPGRFRTTTATGRPCSTATRSTPSSLPRPTRRITRSRWRPSIGGLPVLCEKPLGMDIAEARQMADAAATHGLITMVPFTYRFMPTNQFVKQLIGDGYVGQPYHLSMRYFAGYARDGAYAWRFDEAKAGSGILGDLGSHWLDMARWFLGEVSAISAHRDCFVPAIPARTRPATPRPRTAP